jgi:hypothetical protein
LHRKLFRHISTSNLASEIHVADMSVKARPLFRTTLPYKGDQLYFKWSSLRSSSTSGIGVVGFSFPPALSLRLRDTRTQGRHAASAGRREAAVAAEPAHQSSNLRDDADKGTGVKIYDFLAAGILPLQEMIDAVTVCNNAVNARPNDICKQWPGRSIDVELSSAIFIKLLRNFLLSQGG